MLKDIIHIAILCIVIGSASIPISFTVNSSPIIVWLGNALGSLISALVVIYIGDHISSRRFKQKVSKHRVGRKVVTVFDEGDKNKHVLKARILINKHGLRLFAFFCPIFPGVLIATVTVYLLDLNKQMYKRWMVAGVFFASGAYVFAYWFTFVRPH
jgi:formate/nitrite transporter FocA (FNT family)